jgi:zinc transporter, ZIP family
MYAPTPMPEPLVIVLLSSGAAAAASVIGGLVAMWHRSSSLVTSLAFGFAGGALLGTVSLEMLPTSLELGSLPGVLAGFAVGTLGLYGFDMIVHGGHVAGEHADQRRIIRRYHRRKRGDSQVLVLAGGTSVEELVEGLVIGVGAAIEPTLSLVVALAITIDNLSEGVSVGELIRDETPERGRALRRVVAWTGTIGLALFGSSLLGWLLLRGISPDVLSMLLAAGGGAMLYLTLSSLVPEGEARQYQRSATLAGAAAFCVILVLAALRG